MTDPQEEQPILTKFANATLDSTGSTDLARINNKRAWVGGKAYLFENKLMFNATKADKAINPGAIVTDFGIELSSIVSLEIKSWLGYKTIVIKLKNDGPSVGFRCFGVTKFVEAIRSQMSQN